MRSSSFGTNGSGTTWNRPRERRPGSRAPIRTRSVSFHFPVAHSRVVGLSNPLDATTTMAALGRSSPAGPRLSSSRERTVETASPSAWKRSARAEARLGFSRTTRIGTAGHESI